MPLSLEGNRPSFHLKAAFRESGKLSKPTLFDLPAARGGEEAVQAPAGPTARPAHAPRKPLWGEETSLSETSELMPLAVDEEKVLEQKRPLGGSHGSVATLV